MKINCSILFKDEDGNYIYSSEIPPIIAEYIVYLKTGSYNAPQIGITLDSQYNYDCDITEDTRLSDLLDPYIEFLEWERDLFYTQSICVQIRVGNDYVQISNYNYSIKHFLEYYPSANELELVLVFSLSAGEIRRDGRIRYYMHSKEAGRHNEPHVHVDVGHDYSASVRIIDAITIDGELPPKSQRKILKWIQENKEGLLRYWNMNTDGLQVDLNHKYGLTT